MQVSKAAYYSHEEVFGRINHGLGQWLDRHGYDSIRDVVGMAHG